MIWSLLEFYYIVWNIAIGIPVFFTVTQNAVHWWKEQQRPLLANYIKSISHDVEFWFYFSIFSIAFKKYIGKLAVQFCKHKRLQINILNPS